MVCVDVPGDGAVAVTAATVELLRPVVNAAFVARWIVKPVSLFELSTQVRLIWLEETATADRPLGVAGPVTEVRVVAWTVFEL